MTQEKWAGWSKTIIGIMTALMSLLTMTGVALSAEDVNEIVVALTAALGVIGTIMGVVGRVSARGGIYFNPFK